MSLGAHLRELRNRIFLVAAGLLVGSIVGWFLAGFVLDGLEQPIRQIIEDSGREASLNYPTVTSSFDVRLQLAITVGVVVSSPWWLWQVWAFVVPALKRTEKRFALGFLGSAIPLFFAGCFVGWIILPHLFALLTSFGTEETTAIIDAKQYIDFVLRLLVAIGIGFVAPVFLVLLNFMGILSGRSIFKAWRWALLIILLFTAIVTPSADVLSMFLLAIPIVALYCIAGVIAVLRDRRKAKRFAAEFGEVPGATA